jgi:hypothetical protein
MGRACGTHGERRMRIEFRWEIQKERGHYEHLDVGGRIILKWILERCVGVVRSGLIWLRIRTT